MMITTTQARIALGERHASQVEESRPVISEDLLRRAMAAALSAPDVRADRVAAARARLDGGLPDSHLLAEKIVCRVVSDCAS